MADAKSPAGALGVMQDDPDTGRKSPHSWVNIFGILLYSFYLKTTSDLELFFSYESEGTAEQSCLASAAYNAGSRMVRRWLPEEGLISADIWVEIIPFFETRNYIEKVLTNRAVYRQRLRLEPERLSDLMPDVFSEKAFNGKSAQTVIESSSSILSTR